MSILLVNVYTMIQFLYHELCLYHEPLPITRVIVHTMSPETVITEIQKKLQQRLERFIFTEIHKCKLQKYKNTNYRSAEMQITGSQKYKLNKSSPIVQKPPIVHI